MKIADALFSKTQQQILRLLYIHPEQDFYTNEIIKICQSGTGTVQRELTKLTSAEIITTKQVGNQKRYQANPNLPIYSELRSIIIKTFGIAQLLQEALTPLQKHIELAFIYGSIAKGNDHAKSDIDIIIVSDKITYSDLFKALSECEATLSRKINPNIYTVTEWNEKTSKDNHFISKILTQAKIMLIGQEDEQQLKKSREHRSS